MTVPLVVYICAMQTVAETPTFTRQADKLFSENEKRKLIDFLAENPMGWRPDPWYRRRPQAALRGPRAKASGAVRG